MRFWLLSCWECVFECGVFCGVEEYEEYIVDEVEEDDSSGEDVKVLRKK